MAAALDNPARGRAFADAAQRHATDALSVDAMLRAVEGVYAAVLREGVAK
jgi:hypothetical protein